MTLRAAAHSFHAAWQSPHDASQGRTPLCARPDWPDAPPPHRQAPQHRPGGGLGRLDDHHPHPHRHLQPARPAQLGPRLQRHRRGDLLHQRLVCVCVCVCAVRAGACLVCVHVCVCVCVCGGCGPRVLHVDLLPGFDQNWSKLVNDSRWPVSIGSHQSMFSPRLTSLRHG